MNNPYLTMSRNHSCVSSDISWEELLSLPFNSKDTATILARIEQNVSVLDWTFEKAQQLIHWISSVLREAKADKTQILEILVQAMAQWNDCTLYAVFMHEQQQPAVLDHLLSLPKDHLIVIRCLGTLLKALDRMEWLITIGKCQSSLLPTCAFRKMEEWVPTALQMWGEERTQYTEQHWIDSIALLNMLLSRGSDWPFELQPGQLQELMQQWKKHAIRLLDTNMPFTSYTMLSLECTSLLVHLSNKEIGDGDSSWLQALQPCVSTVCTSLFNSGDDIFDLPRWTLTKDESLFRQCLYIWRLWEEGVPSAHKLWSFVLCNDQKSTNREAQWNLLYLACVRDISAVRHALDAQVSESCSSNFIETIVPKIVEEASHHPGSLACLSVLRIIMESTRSNLADDKISLLVWNGVDRHLVQRLVSLILTSTKSREPRQTRMLCLLDILYLVLRYEPKVCQQYLQEVSSETIEALLNIIASPVKDDDDRCEAACFADSEESTPPANNLSRIDDSISFNVEEGATPTTGILCQWIQMAAVALFAELASSQCCMDDSGVLVLQSRLRSAIAKFIENFPPESNDLSFEETRRRVRLWNAISAFIDEDYIASVWYGASISEEQSRDALRTKVDHYRGLLSESQKRIQQLENEKNSYKQKLEKQSVQTEREKSAFEWRISHQAKEQSKSHAMERQRAQKRAEEMETYVASTEAKVSELEKTLLIARKAETDAVTSLDEVSAKVKKLETEKDETIKFLHAQANELQLSKNELSVLEQKYNDIFVKENHMTTLLNEHENAIATLEDQKSQLQANLEAVFADIVTLAQMYEIKEREEEKARESGEAIAEKLRAELEHERNRYQELKRTMRERKYENESLCRKYEKTKEKGQHGREHLGNDHDQQRRSQPLSYFNQLKISTSSDLSKARSHGDKENSLPQSSSLAARMQRYR